MKLNFFSSRNNNLFIISTFLIFLVLPIIFSDMPGGSYSENESRILGTFPEIVTDDLRLAPGIKTYGERWLNDNIGFRKPIMDLQEIIDFNLLNVSPSNKVIIGDDDWYFYTRDNNIGIGLGTYKLSKTQLAEMVKHQGTIQQTLQSIGVEYAIVLIPSKASVYPEYIGGDPSYKETIIDNATSYLEKNTLIPIINLKPALFKEKENELVYFKQDTHWNDNGLYVGYQTIINALYDAHHIQQEASSVTTYESTHIGDLVALMGLADIHAPEQYDRILVTNPKADKIFSGDGFEKISKLVESTYGGQHFHYYQNSFIEDQRLLIYGDSFFKESLVELLAEHFSEVIFINSQTINLKFIDGLSPDYVIYELSERRLDELWK